MRWTIGEATIESLISVGKLKRRPSFSVELNHTAFTKLDVKIRSMDLMLESGDYETAVSLAHEIVRKALTCLLHAQGLDIDDVNGSHRTVEETALAQFSEPKGPLRELRAEIQALRHLRHESEYQSELTELTSEDAEDAKQTALKVRDVVGRLMPHLSVF